MNIFTGAKNGISKMLQAAGHVFNEDRFWQTAFTFARQTLAGEQVTAHKAYQLSAYFAGVRVISEDVAKLPLVVLQVDGSDKNKLRSHPVFKLLHRAPNPEITSFTFRETLTQYAITFGNGFAEIQRNGSGTPVALWPIHPSRVTIRRDRETLELIYIVRSNAGQSIGIPAADMLHIRGMGSDLIGMSILELARESIGLGLAQQSFASTFFGNGANVNLILKHPQKLESKILRRLRKSWNEVYGGPRNSNKIVILEDGMDLTPISMPLKDAQFIQSRSFQIEEIARWFRIAPHKIGHLNRSTFNNIEQQSIDHVTDTLMPWLVRWEMEYDRKLLPEEDIFAEHKVQGLLRGDSAARANFYSKLIPLSMLLPNEGRALEGLNSIPGGDQAYIMANLIPVMPDGMPKNMGQAMRACKAAAEDGVVKQIKNEAINLIKPYINLESKKLATKQANAVARINKKTEGKQTKADEFFARHEEDLYQGFLPALEGLLKPGSSEMLDGEVELRNIVRNFCMEALANFRSVDDREQYEQAMSGKLYNSIVNLISKE